jgi:uncharacterized membrane protein YqhA
MINKCNWEYITDNSMYENFISYLREREEESNWLCL